MVVEMELTSYSPRSEPRFGQVVHDLKFFPLFTPVVDEYRRPVALRGLIARELVNFLNSRLDYGFACEGSFGDLTGVVYKGRRILTVQQESAFKVSLTVSVNHPHLNNYVEQFIKEQYPLKEMQLEVC